LQSDENGGLRHDKDYLNDPIYNDRFNIPTKIGGDAQFGTNFLAQPYILEIGMLIFISWLSSSMILVKRIPSLATQLSSLYFIQGSGLSMFSSMAVISKSLWTHPIWK
jgi:hypothetical protein